MRRISRKKTCLLLAVLLGLTSLPACGSQQTNADKQTGQQQTALSFCKCFHSCLSPFFLNFRERRRVRRRYAPDPALFFLACVSPPVLGFPKAAYFVTFLIRTLV